MDGLSFFNLASQRLGWLAEGQRVVAENVANADTPGFKARKISEFEQLLEASRASELKTTDAQHISGTGGPTNVKVSVDENTWGESLNGNTVILEQQTIKANEIGESYQVAASLYRKGHESIAFIGGLLENNDRTQSRLDGYRAALMDHNLPVDEQLIRDVPFEFEDGSLAMRELLAVGKRIDAVFAASDILALGALLECNRQDLSVPGDIAVAGFDDERLASLIKPSLTTIGVPRSAIGSKVADIVLSPLRGEPASLEQPDGRLVPVRFWGDEYYQRLEDPALCAQLGAAARETARADFGTWADCAARFEHVYRSLS